MGCHADKPDERGNVDEGSIHCMAVNLPVEAFVPE